jgi:superfamily II DNA or RNA helicase
MPHWESDLENNFSYLKEGTEELEKALFNDLKIREKNYWFNPRFRSGLYDGFVRFYDLVNKRLRTGMIPFAREAGFDFDEVITAKNPLAVEDYNLEFTLNHPGKEGEIAILNEYQEEVVVEIAQGARRGIFDHATSSGKTLEIASICKLLDPLRVTVTVPNIELLIQTKDSLAKMLGEPIGQLGGGKKDFETRVIVIYDGFAKQWERSPFVKNLAHSTQVLISDELQTVTKRLFPFFRKCVNAYYRYGFSGSFFEIDPERIFSVGGFFGGVITKVGDLETMEAGRSVAPTISFFEYPLLQVSSLDYIEAYEKACVTNIGFNKFFASKLKQPYENGDSILVLVKRVVHTEIFQKALGDLGIDSEVYHGKMRRDVKDALISEFSKGRLPVLICTEQTMGVGIDIPRINLLLNLGGGLSGNSTKQKYGRSLRSADGKSSVEIYEPYFTGHRWFARHSKARLGIAKRYATGKVKLVLVNGAETVL